MYGNKSYVAMVLATMATNRENRLKVVCRNSLTKVKLSDRCPFIDANACSFHFVLFRFIFFSPHDSRMSTSFWPSVPRHLFTNSEQFNVFSLVVVVSLFV